MSYYQTEKMWSKMMRVEALIVEKLNNHEEAVERGFEWEGKRHVLSDHEYWLLREEYRTLNT